MEGAGYPARICGEVCQSGFATGQCRPDCRDFQERVHAPHEGASVLACLEFHRNGAPGQGTLRFGHERGAIAHIDGAPTFGAANVNLHDLACDSYSGSAHKWFMGPKEAGIFYVKADRVKDYWALIVGSGWGAGVMCENPGARKFECMGQRNEATLAAVGKAADFHMLIGEARIEARISELATALKRGIAEIPGARLYTPMKPELSLGVIQFDFGSGVDLAKVYTQYEKYGVAGAGVARQARLEIC